jgi:hypothetical protein
MSSVHSLVFFLVDGSIGFLWSAVTAERYLYYKSRTPSLYDTLRRLFSNKKPRHHADILGD